jgi:hypothetical protein
VGDYDNDGDLDLVLLGYAQFNGIARVYRSSGGANPTFSDISAGFPDVYYGSVAWGDYDNDGDLDIVLTGCVDISDSTTYVSRIYRNNGGANPTFTDIGAGLPALSVVRSHGVTTTTTAIWIS